MTGERNEEWVTGKDGEDCGMIIMELGRERKEKGKTDHDRMRNRRMRGMGNE